jgi:transcriptional regulator with XRE-family HTH domain
MRFERAHIRSLGRKIRMLRQSRSWSLSRLSKNSGVSIAAIQKIEAGASNPSLATVVAVVDALGASVDQLISEVRRVDQGAIVARGAQQSKPGSIVSLSTGLADRRLDCRVIAFSARQKREGVAIRKPLFGYILDGGLQLNFADGNVVELSTGDAFHTTADTSPEWSNSVTRRSLVLCIDDLGSSKSTSRRSAMRQRCVSSP